jgi:2-phosphoglycerate kinase
MFSICPQCQQRRTQYLFRGARHICANCSYSQPFTQLPLFVITGASGAGKSTIAMPLAHRLSAFTVLEVDTFLQCAPLNSETDYQEFRDYCLRVACEVMQNGQPVVLIGSTTPGQYEQCSHAGFFSSIHYCALVADDQILAGRLKARPDWRKSRDPRQVEVMLVYNRWFKDHAEKFGLHVIDNSTQSIDDCVTDVMVWLDQFRPISFK